MMMLLFSLCCFVNAYAADWLVVRPDRFNQVYFSGENAHFHLRWSAQPQDSDFSMKTTVEHNVLSEVSFHDGVALFNSESLEVGSQVFIFRTYLVQMNSPEEEMYLLEEKTVTLEVLQ